MQWSAMKREMRRAASRIMLNDIIKQIQLELQMVCLAFKYIAFSNNYYQYQSMLFSGGYDSDRERKSYKSKIYKQMLDNQILFNEQYKHQKNSKEPKRPLERSLRDQQYKEESNQQSTSAYKRTKNGQKRINLPLLKDKNTYLEGESKFIKVETIAKKKPMNSHFKTQLVEEDDGPDQYNITCERIIKELKSINKQSPKMKYRRRLYEYSQLAPNRKRYQKNDVQQSKKSENDEQNGYKYGRQDRMYTEAKANSTINREPNSLYYSKLNLADTNSYENIRDKSEKQQNIPSFVLLNPLQEKKVKYNQEKTIKQINNRTSTTTQPPPSEQAEGKPLKASHPLSIANMKVESNEFLQSSTAEIVSKEEKPLMYSSDINSLKINPSQNRENRLNQIKVNKRQRTAESAVSKEQLLQRKQHNQNFLSLLRKVKTRGQSLYMKLSTFPSKLEIQNNKQ